MHHAMEAALPPGREDGGGGPRAAGAPAKGHPVVRGLPDELPAPPGGAPRRRYLGRDDAPHGRGPDSNGLEARYG